LTEDSPQTMKEIEVNSVLAVTNGALPFVE
jgi:hypothetical protein